MGEYLRAKAASGGLANVETVLASAESLPLVDALADIVVSNYCMHELSDDGKRRALEEIRRVLKPGGRLVIGDMMFSLNALSERDRTVVLGKVRLLAARGLPAGEERGASGRGALGVPGRRGLVARGAAASRVRGDRGRAAGPRGGCRERLGAALAARRGRAARARWRARRWRARRRGAHGSASSDDVPLTLPSELSRSSAERRCLR
jgi:SAM-dependent methyltransferase